MRIGKLVPIQRVMLHRSPDEPNVAFYALDEQPAAGANGDICVGGVEIVVRGPESVDFHIEIASGGRNVHGHDTGEVDVRCVYGATIAVRGIWG